MVMAAVSIEALASGLEMAAITAEREAGEAVSWSQAAGYELKVGGVQVTAANKDVITAAINEKWGPGSASGTITYTPSDRWDEPSRLTLNNACISRGIFFSGFDVYGNKLQIQLIGRNRVTVGNSTYENRVMGAVISLDSFTLSGPGSLEAESGVGAAVTLSANSFYPLEDSKIFKGWNTRADGSGDSYASGSILTMPGANLILYAQWETMRGDISYLITASAGAGGRISPMGHIPAAYGESKAFTITPDSGYEIGDVTVDGESMGAVSYYIFENITDDHSITVSFQKKTVPSEHVSGDGQGRRQDDIPVSWPFSDVKESPGHWKYENIKYVWKNRIMNGISGTNLFRPDHSLTRAMFAAVLYRMAGEPQVEFTQKFTDVEPGIWYSDAVIWVNIQGMAEGFGDGSYGINRDITREQIAKMLYLFGKAQGYAVSDRRELNSFTDGKDVSRWAVDYMRWAAAVEMITGKPNDAGGFRLDPRGKATRAECAKMLTMFMERYQ